VDYRDHRSLAVDRGRFLALAFVVLLVATVLTSVTAHAEIVYLYDDLGRLSRVVVPDGNAGT
jgi:YD repeat-containing protein